MRNPRNPNRPSLTQAELVKYLRDSGHGRTCMSLEYLGGTMELCEGRGIPFEPIKEALKRKIGPSVCDCQVMKKLPETDEPI